MGLRYSCGHISGPHEPIPTQFGLWIVFHHAPPIYGIQNAEIQKKSFCDVIASVLCKASILQIQHTCTIRAHQIDINSITRSVVPSIVNTRLPTYGCMLGILGECPAKRHWFASQEINNFSIAEDFLLVTFL